MIKHYIDLTLTEEQTSGMEGWLELLQESMSMLVSVSGPDSRRLFKLGAKSEAFVRSTLEAAAAHEALLPAGIREHMERDAALRERLRPIMVKLQNLLALVEGSYKLAGADLMKNGTAVYQILRLNGYQEGLEPLLEQLGTRFARSSKKKAPAAESLAPATMDDAPVNEAPSYAARQTRGSPVHPTSPSGDPVAAAKNPPIAHHPRPEVTPRILPPLAGSRFRPLPKRGWRQMGFTE
jgi:hypothetical protein